MAELSTVAKVRTLVLPYGVTADDTFIGTCLERAELKMRRICGRPDGWMTISSHVETFGGDRTCGPIVLTYSPVLSITSVKIYTGATASTTVSSSLYRINDAQDTLYFPDGSNSAAYNAAVFTGALDVSGYSSGNTIAEDLGISYPHTAVDYIGGYASVVPYDLEHAANEVAVALYLQARGNKGVRFFDMDTDEMTKYIRSICQPFIRHLGVA